MRVNMIYLVLGKAMQFGELDVDNGKSNAQSATVLKLSFSRRRARSTTRTAVQFTTTKPESTGPTSRILMDVYIR